MAIFKGAGVAIATPFNEDLTVNYEEFGRLIEFQIENGTDAIIVCGTTGESATLSEAEHVEVIRWCVEKVAHRIPVIAGTGSNSTETAIMLSKEAEEAGVDGLLIVTPYYNKATQKGLIAHYTTIANAVKVPIILYNVPSRTGRDISLETVVRLSKHPNVAAVKEASGSVARVSATVDACDLAVLSGDDMLAFPMIAVGAQGVISVASNVAPALVSKMINAALAGDMANAATLHKRLYRLFRDLFIDTNPIPVKCALALMGRIEEVYRLPLCETSDACRAQIRATLAELKLV